MGVLISPETCRRAELLARSHCLSTAADIVGVSRTTLWRIRKRGWKPWSHEHEKRPMPSDFAIQERHMTHGELRAHYRAGSATITRWRKELRG